MPDVEFRKEGRGSMKTSCFDAVVNFSPVDREKPLDVSLLIQGEKISASFFL